MALREKCASQAETIAKLTGKEGVSGDDKEKEDGASAKRQRSEEVTTSVGHALAAANKRHHVGVQDAHLVPVGTCVFVKGKPGKVTKAGEGGMYAGKGCGRLDGNSEPYIEVCLDDGEKVRNGYRTFDIFLDGTRNSPPVFIEA
jgi:hypothetical protein